MEKELARHEKGRHTTEGTHTAVSITDDNVRATDLTIVRARELHFFDARPDLERQLVGEWVALDGDELISHGTDLDDVLQRAEDAGHPNPFVTRVLDPTVTYVF
jgi:hypothetical protein